MRRFYAVRDEYFIGLLLSLGLVIPSAFFQLNLTPATIWAVTVIFACSFGRPADAFD